MDLKTIKYKGAIGLSYFAMFFEGALNVIIVSLMLTLAHHFQKTNMEIATLVSAKSFGTMITLYIAGNLSDKYGRKNIIFIGLMFFVVFILGFMFSPRFEWLLVAAFLGGIGHGLMDSPGITLLFDALEGNTGPAMSFVQVFFSGGAVFMTLLSTLFIALGWPWQTLFGLFLGLAIVMFVLIQIITFPPVKKVEPAFEKEVSTHKPFPLKPTILLGLSMILYASVQAIFTTWIPTFGVQVKAFSEASSLTLLTSFQIGSVTGAFVFAQLLRRLPTSLFMYVNPGIASVLLLLNVFIPSQILTVLLFAMTGFTVGIYFSLCLNMGGKLFANNAGTATGAIGTANMLGNTIMIWFSGILLMNIGVKNLFLLAAIILVVLVFVAYRFKKSYQQWKRG